MLGGLFPLHDEDCKTLRELETLHRVEAMVYAIEIINNMTSLKDILPNISIGYEIYDTCSSEAVSLSNGLRFVRYFEIKDWHCTVVGVDNGYNGSSYSRNPVLGVIGTESSSTTLVVDQMYSIFHLPLLSYFATSDDLSDIARFPYFLRVVPPDSLQVQAIVDLLLYFNWSYVSFVYSDDSYGRNAIKGFKKLIKDLPICLAGEFEVVSGSPSTYFDDMIETIQEHDNARVVILFVSISDANNFFAAMNRTDTIGELQLIGSDGWGMSITEIQPENIPAVYGALKTHLADEIILNYEQYFKKLNVTNRKSNPWFSEFWYEYLNCSHRVSDVHCLNAYRPGFSEESGVSRVMDSVLVYARAMDALLRDKCPGLRPLCVRVARNINNTELFSYMKISNFTGYTGHISFDGLGDMKGIYEIENIHCPQNTIVG
ncbi:metabotropic glutamate receptor 4-like [Amphiura filiformis]|uniref:metabotropic glutamate receptor 4-like n=1 Tax=Amphiura filiformis TaxID=82378 RepID=UPI003B2232B5